MFRTWSSAGVCFGLGLGCLLAARGAAAQRKSFTDVVHFELDGSLLSYSSTKVKLDPAQLPSSGGGLGGSSDSTAATESTTSETTFGLPGSGLGVGLGVGVSDNLLIGAQLELFSSKVNVANAESNSTVVQFLPRLEYLFEGADVRPYLAAVVGLGHGSSSATGSSDSSTTQLLFGGGLGLHAFLSDSLSIDSGLLFLGESGSGTSTIQSTSFDGTNAGSSSTSVSYSTSGYTALFTLGLSGWVGGKRAVFGAPEPSAESAPPMAASPMAASPMAASPMAAPPMAADEDQPLSASISLGNHRLLYLQVADDPNLPVVVAHVYVPEADAALADCLRIGALEGEQLLRLRITSRGERTQGARTRHFVAGTLPIHAVTVLARAGSAFTVCDQSWPLNPKARHQIHAFLAERLEISDSAAEALEPEPSSEPAAPEAPPPAPAAPGSVPVPAPVPAPAPAPGSGPRPAPGK